jgi:hypothetical protein
MTVGGCRFLHRRCLHGYTQPTDLRHAASCAGIRGSRSKVPGLRAKRPGRRLRCRDGASPARSSGAGSRDSDLRCGGGKRNPRIGSPSFGISVSGGVFRSAVPRFCFAVRGPRMGCRDSASESRHRAPRSPELGQNLGIAVRPPRLPNRNPAPEIQIPGFRFAIPLREPKSWDLETADRAARRHTGILFGNPGIASRHPRPRDRIWSGGSHPRPRGLRSNLQPSLLSLPYRFLHSRSRSSTRRSQERAIPLGIVLRLGPSLRRGNTSDWSKQHAAGSISQRNLMTTMAYDV